MTEPIPGAGPRRSCWSPRARPIAGPPWWRSSRSATPPATTSCRSPPPPRPPRRCDGRRTTVGRSPSLLADDADAAAEGRTVFQVAAELFPDVRRGLLVEWGAWGDRDTADLVLALMAQGQIDYYVIRPWHSPDEYFHRTVTEFLVEWDRAVGPATARGLGGRRPRSRALARGPAPAGLQRHPAHASWPARPPEAARAARARPAWNRTRAPSCCSTTDGSSSSRATPSSRRPTGWPSTC